MNSVQARREPSLPIGKRLLDFATGLVLGTVLLTLLGGRLELNVLGARLRVSGFERPLLLAMPLAIVRGLRKGGWLRRLPAALRSQALPTENEVRTAHRLKNALAFARARGRGLTALPRSPEPLRRAEPVAPSPADRGGLRVVRVARRERPLRSPRRARQSAQPPGRRAAARASPLQTPPWERSAPVVGGQHGDAGARTSAASPTHDRALEHPSVPQGASPLFGPPDRGSHPAELSARNRNPLGPLRGDGSGRLARGRHRAVPRPLREALGRAAGRRLGAPSPLRREAPIWRARRDCDVCRVRIRHDRVHLRGAVALLDDRRGLLLLPRPRSSPAGGRFPPERDRSGIRDGGSVPLPPERPH